MDTVTQSVPGGCLLRFFGLLALVFSGLSGYAGWLVFQSEVLHGQETQYSYHWLFAGSIAGLFMAGALTYYGFKLAMRVEPYDSRDPKEPMLKF